MKNYSKRKIIVYGGNGLIGSRLVQTLSYPCEIIAPSHAEVDLTKKKIIENHIKTHYPNIIIYAAGLTNVDACERNLDQAVLLNTKAPEHIAKIAAKLKIPMIYFSTDAVFDGKNDKYPYKEDDKPNPISVYGKTKCRGEEFVLSASTKNIVVRLITVYSSFFKKKLDPARRILEGLRKKENVYGITDQVINPIFVDDIVAALLLILRNNTKGIYHLGATDYVTNYEFAKKIAHQFHLNDLFIMPISLQEFFKNSPAKRTQYCWLDTKRFTSEFGKETLHTVDEGIALFKQELEIKGTKL